MAGVRALFDEVEIAARVDALAAEIARTIRGNFVVVGLLKGAVLFVADLVRALDRAGASPEIEFLRLASYGLEKESRGEVRLVGEVPANLAGRPILLVDAIVDSGRSLAYAVALLRRHGVEALWSCALIDKPLRRQVAVKVDFIGFSIGDLFVVGYGTDHGERHRHLPYIGVVELAAARAAVDCNFRIKPG